MPCCYGFCLNVTAAQAAAGGRDGTYTRVPAARRRRWLGGRAGRRPGASSPQIVSRPVVHQPAHTQASKSRRPSSSLRATGRGHARDAPVDRRRATATARADQHTCFPCLLPLLLPFPGRRFPGHGCDNGAISNKTISLALLLVNKRRRREGRRRSAVPMSGSRRLVGTQQLAAIRQPCRRHFGYTSCSIPLAVPR